MTPDTLQWLGCATAVIGSLLLALNNKHSGWGFVLFLISNGFWLVFGLQTGAPGLVATQIIFTGTSLLGIYKWLLPTHQTGEPNQDSNIAPQSFAAKLE